MFSSGSRLGPYEIVSRIGAGGMGEVWRARDTRLDRDVAVKVLPAEFASNAQLKLRFEREAKTISQLSHPNICTLFDVGDNYLVMELLEGESLADRLAKGPLPLSEVFKYGAQIAEALDRAHRAGVVHRDLKPGNVVLTKSGAKLLDFGLAKSSSVLSSSGTAASRHDDATAVRVDQPLTEQGTILGTFQYMAPEQLDGVDADHRTDIFAFGAVLYEMATGHRAFEGKTKSSLIASIVNAQPRPVSQLQPLTPPALEHVIFKCLQKDPDDRWQSAHDVAEELRWIAEMGSQAGVPVAITPRRKRRERLAWGIAAAAITVAAISAWNSTRKAAESPLYRLTVPLPANTVVEGFGQPMIAISPDGTRIAYAAVEKGIARLWLRHADRFEPVPLPGTENALCPFFSPDGQWIGFASNGVLKKVAVTGGAPITLSSNTVDSNFRGGTWSRDGIIYFVASANTAVMKVSAEGGTATEVSRFDPAREENSHRWPQLLPDNEHILITTKTPYMPSFDLARICVVSIRDGSVKTVIEGGTYARYLPNGRIVFARGSTLYAVPFDLKSLKVTGSPAPVVDQLYVNSASGGAYYDVSESGALIYIQKPSARTNAIMWADRQGNRIALNTTDRPVDQARVSPDGRFIAFRMTAANDDIGVYDVSRRTLTRLSFDAGNEETPIWTPDGKRVIYGGEGIGNDRDPVILWKPADGSGASEVLLKGGNPSSVSPDGKYLAYVSTDRGTQGDLWLLSLHDRKRIPLLQTPFEESLPMFSPDGKWIAYQSNESGRHEIYVRSVQAGGGRWQISADGGVAPRWSPDGRELFYWNADYFYRANVSSDGAAFDPPERLALSLRRSAYQMSNVEQYDIDPQGRFVMTETQQFLPINHINFVTNWVSDVARRTRG